MSSFITSWIPTTAAAVTRSADQCYIPPANMGFFVAATGSWAVEFIQLDTSGTNCVIVGQQGGTGNATPFFTNAAYNVSQWDGGGGIPLTSNGFVPGTVAKGATNTGAGTGSCCLNGGAVGSAAVSSGFPALAGSGVGFFNPYVPPNADNGMGCIRRLRYWPRVLSNAELQSVTR